MTQFDTPAFDASMPVSSPVRRPSPRVSALSLGRMLLLAGALTLTLTACGRRGPLEPPAGAKNGVEYPEDKETQAETEASSGTFLTSPTGKPAKTNRVITPPKRAFVLDKIL